MTRIEEIRKSTGLSRAAFSRKYNIPVRTLEGWEYGNRQPPEWLPGILEKAIKYDAMHSNTKKYRVKEAFIDNWYGGETDVDYIEKCQNDGIPEEDIKHIVNEYGAQVIDQLEEI